MEKELLTPNEIKALNNAALQRLSSVQGEEGDNFEGDEAGFEGDNYVGLEDDHLDFGGHGKSFLNEERSSITFAFKLQNATAAKKIVALTPTYLGTAASIATATGETVDGILTDGAIITNLTGTAGNSKLTIAGLQSFVKQNPTRILEMTIVSNDTSTFEENITYQHLSPFRTLQNNRIPLTDYIKPEQYNTKKAIVTIGRDYPDVQLNDQTAILLPIGGTDMVATTGIILNINLRLGAILNNSGALNKKATRADKVMSKVRNMPSATAHRFLSGKRRR
jgi:hypothetical protein